MKITSLNDIDINRNGENYAHSRRNSSKLKTVGGSISSHRSSDLLELNESLKQLLDGKAPEVKEAVYSLIQYNLIPNCTVSDPEERAVLLELGLSQSMFIADNYMSAQETKEFLGTMQKIAAIAKTEEDDPLTGEANYSTSPQTSLGASDNYVNINELMKKYAPETHEEFENAIKTGGNWSDILIEFTKEISRNNEWVEQYIEKVDRWGSDIYNIKIENRFEGADTTDPNSFSNDIRNKIRGLSLSKTGNLMNNLHNFLRILGYTI